MTQVIGTREWRRYGFGGPPEPWASGARQDLDRLSTSYYLDVLDARPRALTAAADEEMRARIEELFTTATRHKHEIDYTLRHWATPVERARVEDRLGSLMRISRRMRSIAEPTRDPDGNPSPTHTEPDAA
jgi:hypothetical protein